jgi:hypothetical protein
MPAALTAITAREKVREMNLQINQQLKRAGVLDHKGNLVKTLDSLPDSEWKSWMYDVISVRDYLIKEFNIQ